MTNVGATSFTGSVGISDHTEIPRIKNNLPRIGTSWRHKNATFDHFEISGYFVERGKVAVSISYRSRPAFTIYIDAFFYAYRRVNDEEQ
jgi:hypothetical protein